MDFALNEEQEAVRQRVRRFAEAELNEGVRSRDRGETFPRGLWERCGETGLIGMPVPRQYGGGGLDPLTTAVALEALGRGCQDGGLVFALCAHLLACVVPVWKHGSEEQKRRYLPGLCDGSRIAANAISEPGSGSDAFAMKTVARPEDGGFRLDGTKSFASNGPLADLTLVYALTDARRGALGGVTAFLVERGTAGFRVGRQLEKLGLRSCPMSELLLEDVAVPAAAVVGGVGGGAAVFARAMEWERILLAACHVGTIERLLHQVVERARERHAFGRPIGEFQAVSHRIADMKVTLEAARLLVYRAAWRLDRGGDLALDAAITKLLVSESLLRSALDTVQIFGGLGILTEGDVERILRDAVASTIYSGTSEIQRNMIARQLGL